MDPFPLEPVFPARKTAPVPFQGADILIAGLEDGQSYAILDTVAQAFGIPLKTLRSRLSRLSPYYTPYLRRIRMGAEDPFAGEIKTGLNASALPLFLNEFSPRDVPDRTKRHTLAIFQHESHIALAEFFGISYRNEIDALPGALDAPEGGAFPLGEADFAASPQRNIKKEAFLFRKRLRMMVDAIQQALYRLHTPSPGGEDGPYLSVEQLRSVEESLRSAAEALEADGFIAPYPLLEALLKKVAGATHVQYIRAAEYEMVMQYLEIVLLAANHIETLLPELTRQRKPLGDPGPSPEPAAALKRSSRVEVGETYYGPPPFLARHIDGIFQHEDSLIVAWTPLEVDAAALLPDEPLEAHSPCTLDEFVLWMNGMMR